MFLYPTNNVSHKAGLGVQIALRGQAVGLNISWGHRLTLKSWLSPTVYCLSIQQSRSIQRCSLAASQQRSLWYIRAALLGLSSPAS